jgi:Family of unknown function (DUF6519)
MNGDFKGDFSRDSFGVLRDFASIGDLTYSLLQDTSTKQTGPILRDFSLLSHFSRLLWQQGRVILDADLNEQIDILLHSLRSLAGDLIGPQGGPIYYDPNNQVYNGFALYSSTSKPDQGKAHIRPGHYYVDGILVSNEQDVAYLDQPYLPPAQPNSLQGSKNGYLAYLDVWERQVTSLENDLIREFALDESGPDTATRAQLVWQVKVLNLDSFSDVLDKINEIKKEEGVSRYQAVNKLKQELESLLQSPDRGRLAAKAKETTDEDQNNACIIPPAASYRGPENQLYRVEIHRGGFPWPDTTKTTAASGAAQGAIFVVSRENGSVLFPILSAQAGGSNTVTVTLSDLGRDDSRFTLNANNWVELVDEDNILTGAPGPLYQVSAPPDPIAMTVTLTPATGIDPGANRIDSTKKQLLRLWNYRGSTAKKIKPGEAELADDGALKLRENTWFELENGIQIQFQPSKPPLEPGSLPYAYRTGDYWLIPARTITGNVIWPQVPPTSGSQTNPDPAALPPHGVRHHYAPLAYINFDNNGNVSGDIIPLQYTFKSLVEISLS